MLWVIALFAIPITLFLNGVFYGYVIISFGLVIWLFLTLFLYCPVFFDTKLGSFSLFLHPNPRAFFDEEGNWKGYWQAFGIKPKRPPQ